MYVETGRFLRELTRDVQVAGGRIEVRKFAAPAQLSALPERLVFNCTGLGSRDLFGDQALHPVRGQLAILLPQPEIRYAFAGQAGYMFPRADGILLGGTFERDVWDATPQPARHRAHRRFAQSSCSAVFAVHDPSSRRKPGPRGDPPRRLVLRSRLSPG